jgi:hypothetical protein
MGDPRDLDGCEDLREVGHVDSGEEGAARYRAAIGLPFPVTNAGRMYGYFEGRWTWIRVGARIGWQPTDPLLEEQTIANIRLRSVKRAAPRSPPCGVLPVAPDLPMRRKIEAYLDPSAARSPLSPGLENMLRYAAGQIASGHLSCGAAAENFDLSTAAANTRLRKLESAGLLRRFGPAGQWRFAELTATGHAMLRRQIRLPLGSLITRAS